MKNNLNDKKVQARSFGFAGFYESVFLNSEQDFDLWSNDETIQRVLDNTPLWDAFDCDDYQQAVADNWIDAYLPSDFRLVRCFVHSPKYYNYETDVIIYQTEMPFTVQELINRVKDHPYFEAFLKREFTPCSGFIPFYADNTKDFLERIALNGGTDEVEMGVLISTYVAINNYQYGVSLDDTLDNILDSINIKVCDSINLTAFITDDYQKEFLSKLQGEAPGCKVDEVNGKLDDIWDLCEYWYYDKVHNVIRRKDTKTGSLF